ncbi:MAG: polyprenyl synthetase family protein [Crocinitomicaceae bacterium]|nr:polyprenyl synthetase family protein [Crocinitomicaceae bacterium]
MTSFEELQYLIEQHVESHRNSTSRDDLFEPIRYILGMGGKRMRPALTLMGCEIFGGKTADALDAALAIEIFHNFTLMHDDIMDKAPLRRGQPTVHEKWNSSTAILSGDAMLIQAYELISRSPLSKLPQLLSVFNKTATSVCIGQQLDMHFESRANVSISEYLEMIRLKTAVLLGGALSMGAIIAGAGEEDISHLQLFGEQLGISFQLCDDYLDTFGDPKIFGKQAGGDILSDKKTFLHIRTFEKASEKQRLQLSGLAGSSHKPDQKIRIVKGLMQDLMIDDEALSFSKQYLNSALNHLSSVNADDSRKKYLEDFASRLTERQY